MTDECKSKRKAPISYRPPAHREAELEALVASSGLSMNAFLTEAVFGRGRIRPAELQTLAVLLAKAQRMSDRLDELAREGHHEMAPAFAQARAELSEIRGGILELARRKS